ncbi:RHS repeat protein, partial [Escherichia coli]|uniref:hypothetical protein n=1 Tax=Escherichia coli TaxID=562 RepID=UPI000D418A5C
LIRSEDEGLVTHWHYDEADRLTHRTVKGETAERWQYDERGWLAGMKLGDTPLVDFTRDRLHRKTLRRFGRYELTTAYTPAG